MKSLAIIVRCHGQIPIHFKYGMQEPQLIDSSVEDVHRFGFSSVTTISSAALGGVCFGSSKIVEYLKYLKSIDNEIQNDLRGKKRLNEYINYLYGVRPKLINIQKANNQLFGISFPPKISGPTSFVLNKDYSGDNPPIERTSDFGFFYMESDYLTGVEIDAVKALLEKMSNYIKGGGKITKFQLFSEIQQVFVNDPIQHLYLLDFTCNGYKNVSDEPMPLTQDAANWIGHVFEKHNLRGGEKNTRRKRQRKRQCSPKHLIM